MSFPVALTQPLTVDWKPVSLVFSCKNIFRTIMIAEALTLLAVFAGLFSLFFGLAAI